MEWVQAFLDSKKRNEKMGSGLRFKVDVCGLMWQIFVEYLLTFCE